MRFPPSLASPLGILTRLCSRHASQKYAIVLTWLTRRSVKLLHACIPRPNVVIVSDATFSLSLQVVEVISVNIRSTFVIFPEADPTSSIVYCYRMSLIWCFLISTYFTSVIYPPNLSTKIFISNSSEVAKL